MMAESNKNLAGDIFGGLIRDPGVQQKLAGVMMGGLAKLLAKLFGGGGGDKPKPSKPNIPEGSVVVTPVGGGEDIDETTGRIWSGLHLSVKGVKRNGVHVPAGELDKVKDLSDPVDDGDVVNLDVDPLDQFGVEIGPGSPELDQLLLDPSKGTGKDDSGDNHRLHYAVGGGDFEINGTNRNYGCGPNLKIPRGFKGEATAVVSVFGTTPAGKTITSNAIRVRVKPWQN